MNEQTLSSIADPKSIIVVAQSDHFKPYAFQVEAADALSRAFGPKRAGILRVPTGGGKTAIAVRWLLQNHVAKGGRVLWLAHRGFLLDQAKREFAKQSALAQPRTELRCVTVAGDRARWSNVSTADDLILASIQSTQREDTLGYLDVLVQQSKQGLFVVVDEAHHASAPSYVRVLKRLREYPCRVLGLTATPTRMLEADENRMWRLFDNEQLFSVDPTQLIADGILSKPTTETVQTHVEVNLQADEIQAVQQRGDLSSKVLQRLAENAPRNKLIVEHYLAHQERYRDTIVFAANVAHAATLADEFKKHGVAAAHASYSTKDAGEVLRQYSEKRGVKVLCNVEMTTEGFDAPHTQTVFLARPSQSKSLLWQMIGRALRGPAANGTKDAYLVTFVDTFKDFHPLDVSQELRQSELGELLEPERVATVPVELQHISPALLRELYALLSSNTKGEFVGVHECIPQAWASWEEEYEDDIQTRHVLIWDNQRLGYNLLRDEFLDKPKSPIPELVDEAEARQLIGLFFDDCPDPRPRWQDIAALLQAKQKGCEILWYSFPERDAIDPRHFAQQFYEDNVGERDQETQLRAFWESNAVARLVYKDVFENYLEDVKLYKALESEARSRPQPDPVLLRLLPTERLEQWPDGQSWNLIALREAVLSIPGHFPGGAPELGELVYDPPNTPVGKYWAFYRHSDRAIHVHPLLDSPSIPRFVMEFLMYHELLHADMPTLRHSKEYRVRERRFVPTQEAIDDALARGFEAPVERAGWRNLATQFLHTTWDRFKFHP
ncbi:MAG: DEAD/DEAH box helicase [Myxococcota bacterium]|jgi:superfamily II DNA or RNA helicase|nr:DEAD/DEAH box helicase [Myxococcota bacterium]